MKVFGLVLLLVFVVEGMIMLLLPFIATWQHGSIAESVADATLLATALAPALWFIIVQPLRRLLRERGDLLRRLFEARESERSALARDLHDELGQHLTTLLVSLRALQNDAESEATRRRAQDLLLVASQSLKEVRRIASGLHVSVLDDFGLRIAIERLCEDFVAAHAIVPELSITLPPNRRYGREIETAIYRIVQEALTNIARHAGAQNVHVSVCESRQEMQLRISDDGKGFAGGTSELKAGASSLGVRSMRERVDLLDGWFKMSSQAGHGTIVEARIPIPVQSENATDQE